LPFSVRRLVDELAFTHPAGLTFVVSDPRHRGEHWVHDLEVRLFSGEPLSGSSLSLVFLRLLAPGASIDFGRGHGMPLDKWNESTATIGPSILGLQTITEILSIALNEFRLSDLKDEEFSRSTAFAYMCFCEKIAVEQLIPGFVLNLPADISPGDLLPEKRTLKCRWHSIYYDTV
jgi:hypothetical protein